jgi:catechol 2,3-dioxygenase-like lactoylglutathione lyase family enzyme
MSEQIVQLAIVVLDYDEAIDFYTNTLGFELIEDTKRGKTKRWVRIMPPGGGGGCSMLLAKAVSPEQIASVGNQTGGRVFLFLHTTDFDAYYERLKSHKVQFIGEPRDEDYGKVIVFLDLYGNKWDLIEPKDG